MLLPSDYISLIYLSDIQYSFSLMKQGSWVKLKYSNLHNYWNVK